MRGRRSILAAGAATAAIAVLAAAGVAGAATKAAPTFTVSLTPHTLTAGGTAAVQGTFTNNGAAVSGVAFTFTFPFAVSVPPANGCASVPFAPKTVACVVGLVGAGQTATKSVQFTVPGGTTGPVTVNGVAGWLSPAPPRAGLLRASDTGTAAPVPQGSTLLAANAGCPTSGNSVDSSDGSEGINTQASTPPNGQTCTPITDGVVTDPNGGTPILFTKLPATPDPVTVTLTFADENLPFSNDHGGQPLIEYPNYPDLSNPETVPYCVTPEISVAAETTLPTSTDSCIQSINPSDSLDEDDDGGTVVLQVTPTGNDPGYH